MPASLRHYVQARQEARDATDEELLRWYRKAARTGRAGRNTRAEVAWSELTQRGWTPSRIMELPE